MKTITLEFAKEEIGKLKRARDEAKKDHERSEEWDGMDSDDQDAEAEKEDFEGEPLELEEAAWELAHFDGQLAEAKRIYAMILGVEESELE